MNSLKKQRKMLIGVQTLIFLFIIWLYIMLNTNMIKFIPECIYYEKFGVLCPSCGGTRFIISLLQFNLIDAFYFHPLFFILTIYLMILNISFIINTMFNKKITIFKWWHIVFWAVLLMIFTFLRNINF